MEMVGAKGAGMVLVEVRHSLLPIVEMNSRDADAGRVAASYRECGPIWLVEEAVAYANPVVIVCDCEESPVRAVLVTYTMAVAFGVDSENSAEARLIVLFHDF
jgi:hypothetical protein